MKLTNCQNVLDVEQALYSENGYSCQEALLTAYNLGREAQHKATWAEAVAALTHNCKVCVDNLPCPPLTKE